jgi:hypothetical protein
MPKKKVKKTLKKRKLKKVLKEAQSLPPQERKIFLKKFAISFAKGIAGAAGAIATIGIIYKLSEKSIDNKINSTVRSATREGINELQRGIPGVSRQVQQEALNAIQNVQPVANKMVRDAVTSGAEQGILELEKNQGTLKETAKGIAGAAIQGAQQNVQGPLAIFLGASKKPPVEKPQPNPENKGSRTRKEVDQTNILPPGSKRTRPGSAPSVLSKSTSKKINVVEQVNPVEELRRQTAAKIIQNRFRNKQDYNKENEIYKNRGWNIFIPQPIEPRNRSRYRGIQTVGFGNRKNKVRLSLRGMKTDLNKLKRIK